MKQLSRPGDTPTAPSFSASIRRVWLPALGSITLCAAASNSLVAQETPVATPPASEPAPAAAPAAPAAPPVAEKAPTPTPTEPPSIREIVNSLSQNDIQEAIAALRANFINQSALSEEELNRAALEGLISRLDRGAILEMSRPPGTAVPDKSVPFLAEILDNRVGYIRLGPLSDDSLGQLDAALQTVSERKIPAVALDLRGTVESSDYTLAEKVISRFAAKGKPLFTISRPGAKQEQIFTSKSDPSFTGFVVVLVDGDTAGAVETIAGAIRQQARSLTAGQRTQGRAVEYSNVALSNGRLMRVATGKIVLPPDQSIFPGGVVPDLKVVLSAEDQETIFQRSREGGMSQFVFETERPRLNEAALVAGTNPSIDAYQETRRNPGAHCGTLRDSVLQRALDVVTSIQVIELKTPIAAPIPDNIPSAEAQGSPEPPDRQED